MYSERWRVRKIINRCHYTMKNLLKAEEMLKQGRPAQDVYCQLRAAQGGIQKILDKPFTDANRVDINNRINKLFEQENLSPESAETLTGIQKQLGKAPVKQLLRFEKTVKKMEQLFCWLLFLQTDFLEPLLQNPLWPDL